MLKAIIFDLDGVLVDSTPIQQRASQQFLESFGKVFARVKGREGMRIIDIIQEYKDLYDLPGSIEELYEKRQTIFYKLVEEELELFPDVMPLLTKLTQRGLLLGLATSGDRPYVDILFHKFSPLHSFFQAVTTSEDVIRGKPWPDVYQKTAQKLSVPPNTCIAVEDSANGIAAAKAAGMQVICIPNSHYPDADYSQADRIFGTLEEVYTALS